MFSPYVSGSVKRQPMAFVMAQWALVFSALQVTLSVRRTPGNVIRDSARKHLTSSFTVHCRSQIWAEAPLEVTPVCAVHTRAASPWPGVLDEQGDAEGMNCCDSKWSHFTSSWHWCCCSQGEFLKPFFSFQTGFLHTPSKLLHIFQIEIFAVRLPLLLTVNNI